MLGTYENHQTRCVETTARSNGGPLTTRRPPGNHQPSEIIDLGDIDYFCALRGRQRKRPRRHHLGTESIRGAALPSSRSDLY